MRMLNAATWLLAISGVTAANDSFVETFDGNGPYDGLDNPGWTISGDGEIRDGGYAFVIAPNRDGGAEGHNVFRDLSEDCSFVERIEIRDAFLSAGPDFHYPTTVSWFMLWHILSSPADNLLNVLVHEADTNPNDWELITAAGISRFAATVASGSHIALEIKFDKELSQATFAYDNNIDDNVPATTFGPFSAPGVPQDTHFFPIAGGHGVTSGILDRWTYTSLCNNGDFNNSGALDVEDIDLLSNVVRLGTNEPAYDLNADQLVDDLDRTVWVETLRKTYFGDSSLDGEFNTADLVQVFQAGVYEDTIDGNAGWASGDWNGDADFNSRDLVLAFQSGGYEAGPRPAAVPEPSASLLLLIGIAIAARRRGGQTGANHPFGTS
jgi:hypothetical protein